MSSLTVTSEIEISYLLAFRVEVERDELNGAAAGLQKDHDLRAFAERLRGIATGISQIAQQSDQASFVNV